MFFIALPVLISARILSFCCRLTIWILASLNGFVTVFVTEISRFQKQKT